MKSVVYVITQLLPNARKSRKRRRSPVRTTQPPPAISLLLASGLFAVCVISAVRPVANAVSGSWTACGQLKAECLSNACVKLYDDRDRLVDRSCRPMDNSGFFYSEKNRWWVYRPSKISLSCGTEEKLPISLPPSFVDNQTCSGSLKIQ
jgi:hypothetical protein